MKTRQYLNKFFPQFEEALVSDLILNASVKEIRQGSSPIKTGTHFKSTMLVLSGKLKIFRESEDGEIFIYYLESGDACALSLLCGQHKRKSEVLAQAEINSEALFIPHELIDNLVSKYKSWYQFVVS